ncbi:MAG: peptide chain release factor N(5)-glutamine methyltransferase [Bacteroidales bacterium]|nr:peptide chain release factor N(5)-glutamine methyltransferase [Bacteroidales bacterium]
MTISQFIRNLSSQLEASYDKNEARSIAEVFVCDELKLSRTQMLVGKDDELDKTTLERLSQKSARLASGEPVQYVTGIASFCGMELHVDSNVLIPRQETEMLVETLICHFDAVRGAEKIRILDIGTGSGCIPIAIKKMRPEANLFAIDISEKALEIAKQNAETNNAEISFAQYDILSDGRFPFDEKFDIVVSNPPYVMNSEKSLMHKNVTDFEPSLALYVDDNDPLLFYRSILMFIERYQPERKPLVFFEINENLGAEMLELCRSFGYDAEIIKDLNGKNRFVKAIILHMNI